ncbi:MAG: acyl-CoA dehydrogenase family protein [Chloroflexota bacterium]|nr:acyl-CoA dehydrogenase family protein [Chloroflexota bacterium]
MGSDPRSIKTSARRDGDEWVINGHKWFTSNGKRADFFIVMCRTDDPDGPADRNGKMTQIIVPKDTPGVNIIRGVPAAGSRWRRSSACAPVCSSGEERGRWSAGRCCPSPPDSPSPASSA